MHLLRRFVGIVVLLGFLPWSVWAQTGKITGQVTEAETGDPLPGVNVVIEGTQQGATTDAEGSYTILNVAPDNYTVRASFIGYADQVVEGVEINIELTTEVNFQLQEETVGLDEVTVQAKRPIIQRDISGSQRNIGAAEIASAPYQSINSVLRDQVGSGSVDLYEDQPSIRGSGMSESVFIVDGMQQGDPLTNRPHYRVNLEAVQEMKVQTGGFSAEYGNLRSGLINVVTKEGGEAYSGSIDFQYSPSALKHFGPMMTGFDSPIVEPMVKEEAGAFTGIDSEGNENQFFAGWNAVANEELNPGDPHYGKPMELYARWLWRHRSQDAINELVRLRDEGVVDLAFENDPQQYTFHQYGIHPDWRGSATLGGPVPFTRGKVHFFGSFNGRSTEYAFRTAQPTYEDRRGRLKLTANPAQGVKLNATGFWSEERGSDRTGGTLTTQLASDPYKPSLGRGTWDTRKIWYPNCVVPSQRVRQNYGLDLTHTLSPNTFYEIQLTHNRSGYSRLVEHRETSPLPQKTPYGKSLTTSGSSAGVIEGMIGTAERADSMAAAGAPGWDNWRDWARVRIGGLWYDESPKGHGVTNWKDVTGRYPMETCPYPFNDTYSRSYALKADLTSQVHAHHQVKTGLQLRYDHVYQKFQRIRPATNRNDMWLADARPWTGALYAQDKIEFEGFVANFGVRVDGRYTGQYPMLDLSAPKDKKKGPYTDALLAGNTTNEDGEIIVSERIPLRSDTDVRISPRLGISHPITTVAKVFFNYGHMYQWPGAYRTYSVHYRRWQGSRPDLYGNPAVAPPRTISYEIGYEHNLMNQMNLRLTAYYKDISNELSWVRYSPIAMGGNYRVSQNARFRDVRGLESFLELRRGVISYFSGWASVNYMAASGGRVGNWMFYEDPSRQPRQVSTEVSKADVRPVLRLNASFHTPKEFGPSLGGISPLGSIDLSFMYQWKRGSQFTWNPAGIPYVENNLRWRGDRRVDMRLRKQVFKTGGIESIFYVDVFNLFNQRNMIAPWNSKYRGRWAWDLHDWWNHEFVDYMESLGYTDENENRDGSFSTDQMPGDYKGENIDMPAFTPWTFLEKRDIFFGLKLRF